MVDKEMEQRAIKLVLAHADEYKATGQSVVLDCRTDDWIWALPTISGKSQQYVVWLNGMDQAICLGVKKKLLKNSPQVCYSEKFHQLPTIILGNDAQVKYAKHLMSFNTLPTHPTYQIFPLHQKVNFWTLQKGVYVQKDAVRYLEKIPDENRQKRILKAWFDIVNDISGDSWSLICKTIMLILCNPLIQDYHEATEVIRTYLKINSRSRFYSGSLATVTSIFNQLNLPILKALKWEMDLAQNHKITINWWIYADYIRMRDTIRLIYDIRKLPVFPELNKTSNSKIRQLHDFCTKICNNHWEELHQAELKEKEKQYSENILPKVKCFEMEGNEFSIIATPNLASLVKEGCVLHHCVGSYVDSVKDGSEYILYMRKNSEIDKPYLTVDITPDKNCRQIHGVNNSNVKSDSPEAQFIKEWAEKFSIDVKKINGICCHL